MPALDNLRHERFAQELAKGKSATDAYVEAGYKFNDGNASTLKANKKVIARVAEILDRGAMRAEVTVESLIAEAEEVRIKALEVGQFSAAMIAIKEKGILSGKRIERAEQGKPGEFGSMNNDEIREFISTRIGRVSGGASRTGTEGIESGVLPTRRVN